MVVIASVVLLGALVFVLGWVAPWATSADKDRAAAVNATRQTFLAATAGLVAIAGLVTGARTYLLSREGQLTERYSAAVALLASDKPAERLGGVFALERLLSESPRDHDIVVEVLAAYVRQYAPAVAGSVAPPRDPHGVQAALTVLARRPVRTERNDLNLAGTDLRAMILVEARLRHADLRGSRMEGANLALADCRDAALAGTDLRGAGLGHADLRDADLRRARLYGADVDGARFGGADLRGALLGGVEGVPDVISFTAEQLRGADIDASTELPQSLREIG